MSDVMEDRPARVDVNAPELLAQGFRPYERFRLALHHDDGATDRQVRDIVRGGQVVGVLGYDPARDQVVLIRQFRLSAHLLRDRGLMVEIVAGLVEPGEDPVAAAVRECVEETGVAPRAVLPMLSFAPTPGLTDEFAHIYLGLVDASALPDRAAAQAERCFNCGICNDCDNCRTFCPEAAVLAARAERGVSWIAEAGPDRSVDSSYCKGCGICVKECPRCAMVIEEQQS